MKNRLYYGLFLVYAGMVVFILYINGVFSEAPVNKVNLMINVGFLAVIGIIFIISGISFVRLNRCTDELSDVAEQMYQRARDKGENVWEEYRDKKDVFRENHLRAAFSQYKARMRNSCTARGYVNVCDIEEYVNEDLVDGVGMTFFNSGVSGTLTGLGILGTFLGLSLGLGSFQGNDIFTISDNVGPLLSGMKVAFHTSVYGIFFSLVFNFVYRSIMSDAYAKLEHFLMTFRQCAMPQAVTEDETGAAMLIYQANMAHSMKQVAELLKGNAMEQTAGVERIVKQFTEQMQVSLSTDFKQFGDAMKTVGENQRIYADNCKSLIEAATALVEVNRKVQDSLAQMMKRQEDLAEELEAQKKQLTETCDSISEEVSNQLYTFERMRSTYEK